MEGRDASSGREILFEFTALGRQMRVAAIDAKSGIEVVVITPLTVSETQMKALALAKLRRRLANTGDS